MNKPAYMAAFLLTTLLAFQASSASALDVTHEHSVSARTPGDTMTTVATLTLEEMGILSIRAERIGQRVDIEALDAHGKVIGQARTVVGLGDAPLYVEGPDGLIRIVIVWEETPQPLDSARTSDP